MPDALAYDDSDTRARPARPVWVTVGLWGLPSAPWAWACAALSVAIAVGGVVAAVYAGNRIYLWAVLMVFAAWWYRAAIKWEQRYGRWRP